MNPIAATTWFWRAVRGHSLTFAVLFACALFGISVLGFFRHALHWLGAPWYVWLLAPFLIVSVLAKNEAQWVPDPEKRRRWARWIAIGAVIATVLVAKLTPEKRDEASPQKTEWKGRPGR